MTDGGRVGTGDGGDPRERAPDGPRSQLRGGIVGMALVALGTAGLTLAALVIAAVVSALG